MDGRAGERRRLGGVSEPVRHVCTSTPDGASRLPQLLSLRVESRTDKEAFRSEQMGRFFHRMAPAMAEEGLIRLYELELDGKPVASILCFDLAGQLFLYNSGYDPQYASQSVGLLSKALCLRDAIDSGHRCFDMLRGDEPYKYHLGGKDQTIYRCVIRRG